MGHLKMNVAGTHLLKTGTPHLSNACGNIGSNCNNCAGGTTPAHLLLTVSGGTGDYSPFNGSATVAQFNRPSGFTAPSNSACQLWSNLIGSNAWCLDMSARLLYLMIQPNSCAAAWNLPLTFAGSGTQNCKSLMDGADLGTGGPCGGSPFIGTTPDIMLSA